MLQKQNIDWLDTLRAIATLGVIIIHVSTPTVKMAAATLGVDWWIGNMYDSAVRFSVPLFLLLSGATLLHKEYTLTEFYKKRLMRVLLPFLFWAVVYLVFNWLVIRHNMRPYGFEPIKNWAWQLIVTKGISVHFWFVYMLLTLYIFMPFLGRFLRSLSKRMVLAILITWFLVCTVVVFARIPFDTLPYLPKFISYLFHAGFLVLGYYLVEKDFSDIKYKLWGAILFVGSILFVSIYTYYVSKNVQKLDLIMYWYWSPVSIVQTIAVYLMVAGFQLKNKPLVFVRDILSNHSYGIYLVQIMVIGIFFINGILWTIAPPLISIPLLSILVFVVSAVIIKLLTKIPGGKYISG
jgi:surface polysaccharide O-acyltransferase-like enzyme